MKLPGVLREGGVFVLVGLSATGCNVVAALAAQRLLGLGPNAAAFAGYVCSVGISYLGNSFLTFRRPALHGPQFVRFAAISLAGLAIQLGVVFLCSHLLRWPLWEALVPVVIVVPASTFALAKFWAFRPPAAEPAG